MEAPLRPAVRSYVGQSASWPDGVADVADVAVADEAVAEEVAGAAGAGAVPVA